MCISSWFADVNSFPALDDQIEFGPTYKFEYSTRETYGANITWGPNDPLNATWWHLVTEGPSPLCYQRLRHMLMLRRRRTAMERNSSLIQLYNLYQSKSSVLTPECTGECLRAKICYLRSGSASLSFANCPAGYGTTQNGPYPG